MPKRTSINDVEEIEDLNDLERIVKDKQERNQQTCAHLFQAKPTRQLIAKPISQHQLEELGRLIKIEDKIP